MHVNLLKMQSTVALQSKETYEKYQLETEYFFLYCKIMPPCVSVGNAHINEHKHQPMFVEILYIWH